MIKYNIVGISGKLGSGKDTVADGLSKYGYMNKKYASKLYEVVSIITGVSVNQLKDRKYKNSITNIKMNDKYITYGELLQQIGTKLREIDSDIWVKALFADYKKGDKWAISDVRFPNEVNYIEKNKGKVIRLEGDPMDINKNTKRDKNHISETALDHYFDEKDVILNSDSIGELNRRVIKKLK
jgi:hypothetical protein